MNALRRVQVALERTCSWRKALTTLPRSDLRQTPRLLRLWCSLEITGEFDTLREELVRPRSQWPLDAKSLEPARWFFLGRFLQTRGMYAEAISAYMLAEIHDREDGMRSLIWIQLGSIAFLSGNIPRAEAYLVRARQEAEKCRDLDCAANAADLLAACFIREGKYRRASELLAVAARYCRRSGNRYRANWVDFASGELDCARGKHQKGKELMAKACRNFDLWGARSPYFHSSRRLAAAWLKYGTASTKRARAKKAWEILHKLRTFRTLFFSNAGVLDWMRLRAECRQLTGRITKREMQRCIDRVNRLASASDPFTRLLSHSEVPLSRLEIEEYIRRLTPFEFEELCRDLLRRKGWNCQLSPPNEQGVDIFAFRQVTDALQAKHVAVSCKHRATGGGISERDITGLEKISAIDHCDGFILMTNGRVNRGALNKLEAFNKKLLRTEVIDGDKLVTFIASTPEFLWTLKD